MPELTRRGFVASAMAGLATADRSRAADGSVPNSAGTERPRHRAPAKACDAHFHIIDGRFPPPDTPKPPGMSFDDYRLLQARLGTTRAVPVQPKTHGTDPTCLLDALARFGVFTLNRRCPAVSSRVFKPSVGYMSLRALP